MSNITIDQFPESKECVKSKYDLEFIRKRFSGLIESGGINRMAEAGLIECVYTLANEINELKSEIVELKSKLKQ